MRVLSLHADVLLATSAIWQTNCVIVRGAATPDDDGGDSHIAARMVGEAEAGAETFVIDSPILPEELDALPAVLEQSGFPPLSGLLATHGDWDHLLGRLSFPGVALGCGESTAARLAAAPGAAQRELRAFDERFYIERPHPLRLGQVQALPVPGRCGIGGRELELYPADGHTEDGMAISVPWARVLIAGDYLSTVEAPQLASESLLTAYLDTLRRLRPLVRSAEYIVPGHGPVLDAERALGVLEENLASLTQAT